MSVTTAVTPRDPQAFKRAVRKIKCAGMVASLAKSWQGWATEHTEKQDGNPSGWVPSSIEEEDRKQSNHVVKLTVTPHVIAADSCDDGSSKIRSCSIAKTVQPKRSECSSMDLVNAIRGKMESGSGESKLFLGNESPTRRRQMRALQKAGEAGGGVIQDRKLMLQEKTFGSRSSSVDTEDSGLGEENGLSDSSESKLLEVEEIRLKKQNNRPKVKQKEVFKQIR